jgi:riboflavin synthase
MFTGIVEAAAVVSKIEKKGTNVVFRFSTPLANELKIDQSVSHNGVCLTVVDVSGDNYSVEAIDETLKRSNLGSLKIGDKVNLERCMQSSGRFDGHIVQGHVDQTGIVKSIKDMNGSWLFEFQYDPKEGNITVEKGSICVNGVSLTCFNSKDNGFTVAIIPYTFEHTNFHQLKEGDRVNLEFDIIGKYVQKLLSKQGSH